MEKVLIVAIAVVLDWLLGDPYWLPHPIRGIGWLIKKSEKMVTRWHLLADVQGFMREKAHTSIQERVSTGEGAYVNTREKAQKRSPCEAQKIWRERAQGVVLWLVVVGSTFLIGLACIKVLGLMHPLLAGIGQIALVYTCLAARCLDVESRKVMCALQRGNLEEGQLLLSYLVGRETNDLPEREVVRGTVETVAENTVDGVVAPLLFALLGGAPLALMYKAINTLDSMIGYKNEKYLHLGWASARLDDLANFIPARLTALVIPVAALLYNGNFTSSLRIMLRDRKNHSSPNSAHPEAAVAGALGVQLGGASRYFGQIVEKPTIGDAIKPLAKEMILDTIRLMYITEILIFLVCAGIYIL